MTRGDLQHFCKTGSGLAQAAKGDEGHAEVEPGIQMVRLQLESTPQPHFALGMSPFPRNRNPKIAMRVGIIRPDRNRLTKTLLPLFQAAQSV